ncbi:3'-5' exonuclease, partial [Bacteroides coprosuis]|uniref:3'-5' exonuclease n=1 Tax=Bacteroides coprosuis TaxID=151276 RepID=UPI001D1C3701
MTNTDKVMRPNKKIVVLDFETTGFNVLNGDRVTEVGAITIDGKTGEEMGSFDALVYTDKQIPKKVQELTGITNEMLDK